MKKLLGYIMVFILLGITACEDFLEREPINITHASVFWVNQSNAEQALAGAYALLKMSLTRQANYIYWGEITGMTFMDSKNWICNYIENNGDYVLAYREPTRNWKDLYRAANWAYTIEQYVEGMDVSMFNNQYEKERIIGEAAFIRAISYFYLTRLWGDVPIVKQSIESSDQLVSEDGNILSIPQSDELDVLDFALEAVDKAIGLLEYSSPGDARWAITADKASAEALKAHIALWYASRDNDNTEMLQACVDAATSVINNSNAELIDYVEEDSIGVARMCIGQSKTGLFEINFNAEMNESRRLLNYWGNIGDDNHLALTQGYPVYPMTNGNIEGISPDFYGKQFMTQDADRTNDVRKDLFFYDYESNTKSFISKYQYTSPDQASGASDAKFTESNILILRMADVYLLRAEAEVRRGSSSPAIDDLDLIRSKAGVPGYTGATDRTSMMKAIFEERAIEFVGEGHSGFDRIRMDYYYEGVPWMNQMRIQKKGYYWPISTDIISINPSIVQPEYWRGKL